MSSYFDTMGQCFYDKKAISKLVFHQYRAYLNDMMEEVVSADEEKLSDLITRLYMIEDRSRNEPELMVQRIHDLAHDVGRAGIRLKGGGMVGDNPNIPY